MAIRKRGAEPKYFHKAETPIQFDKFAQIAIAHGLPVYKLEAIISDYHAYIKEKLSFGGATFKLGDICELKTKGVKARRWGYRTRESYIENNERIFIIKNGYEPVTWKIQATITLNMIRRLDKK